MRAIRRFPLPDSHVSLSAVLEPGPTAQPALPPRPTTAQSNLPQNQGAPHPKPIPTDTPQYHDPPRPRTGPLTSLTDKPRHPNRCEFEARRAVSETLARFNHQPTPPIAHDTRTSRPESTQPATPPAPATGERKPNRLCKLFPPQAPASAPMRRSTSKVPNRPGPCYAPDTARALDPTLRFSRCAATYQPEILTEQGVCEHYIDCRRLELSRTTPPCSITPKFSGFP
jgi:hypothetical protein